MTYLSLGAVSIIALSTLVLERTMITSASVTRAMSDVTSPNFLSRSGRSGANASASKITMALLLVAMIRMRIGSVQNAATPNANIRRKRISKKLSL